MRLDLPLSLYQAQLRPKAQGRETLIWDAFRQKYLKLRPEELVRQLLAHHLCACGYPASHLALEYSLDIAGQKRRCDILAFDADWQPRLLVECKAPEVKLDERVALQIAQYNSALSVPYLLISNGQDSYAYAREGETWRFLSEIPAYKI